MKKSILTVLVVLLIVGTLCFICIPREKLKKVNIPFINNGKSEVGKEEMKIITNNTASDYKNGYFYINNTNNKKNIMYFDYDSKKEVFLCNKPNCEHHSSTCSSYIGSNEFSELFYYNNSLYLLYSSAKGESISVSFGGVVDNNSNQTPSTIYKMNLDGTEKQKIFIAPSGAKISMPFVMKGNILYGYLEKEKLVDNGGNSLSTTISERKLIAIHLDTGKYEEIKEGLHESLIGVYNNKLVIQEIDYIKDPNSFGDNTDAFINNLYNSRIEIKLLNIETKKEEIVMKDVYKNLKSLKFYKNGIYFVGEESNNLEYFDFSTRKKQILKELPESGMTIVTIIDDKILVYSYKENNTSIGFAYYIDLVSKEMSKFTLRDKDKQLMKILSSNDDYYFVKLGNIYGDEYTTWAGTKGQSIIGVNYGLIKKVDYWSSKENYIKMTNAG